MKIKNTLCLHILMATLAMLFLCVHPFVSGVNPPLTFQPLIKSMAGTPKEQAEKKATISHALEGNAIFFIGASEVATSEDEHYAVYNYFNKQLHQPVVAYGDAFVDDETQFLLLSRFKNSLNANSKVVLLLAPDSFYSKGLPPAIYADNFPASVFNPLMQDPQARPLLVNYLKHIDAQEISHLTFGQMRVFGWHPGLMWDELSYQFANICTLIKNDWLTLLHVTPGTVQPWPQQPTTHITPDWDKELAHARELNKKRQQSAATLWMDKTIYEEDGTRQQWDDTPVVPAQIAAFRKTVQLLKDRHVQVIAIVDPVNPWALYHTDTFRPVDKQIQTILEANQIPYFDMYAMPYQNGWNWDRLHPSELAWVPMIRFIAQSFK
ncbi:D-alanyl-lipoteichoic acid biosynthesis protein DltD [Enterobacter sichuanensis]|uniref:D-alanyl-lipoteichoic acid biosynthesis protein DltD n=1 Tax=Enterobacter sichuanensis TaxID=2071710 RepID=UPI000CEDF26C|nr:D-alanyl-lipoteichoic acid biosynthesis protein DltD [Enterobacter sichuanensis]MDR0172139.1 D-alanyl-lipoteichoic acid biosynthesis protein DltD [Enterobacter sichuanensis]